MGRLNDGDRRKGLGKRTRRVWRLTLTRRRRVVLDRIMEVEGCNRAEAFDVLCNVHEWGFTSRVKMDVRGRIQAIAAAAELAMRECTGDSPAAAHLREIKKAVLEIPTMLGDGSDGTRVGQVIVLPRR